LPATTRLRAGRRAALAVLRSLAMACLFPAALSAQSDITRVDLSTGRSYPIQTPVAVSRVTIANPEVADVVVIGERDVVINGKATGETDVLLFGAGNFRRHYRVVIGTAADRPQVVLGVKLAEVRRDMLARAGLSGLYRGPDTRAGGGIFRSDEPFTSSGSITIPSDAGFLTVLSNFGTRDLLAFIEAESQKGRARLLAEPNLMAASGDSASFLAGGEIPIPIAQPGQGGIVQLTIQFREFGVRLGFTPHVLNDSLIKLQVRPEVSDLDYANSLQLSGFRVPALRTRRVYSTVDVLKDRSLIISGLFNDTRERVRTGIPGLMDIPLLGALFSSTRWQHNETELVVIVTPHVFDPNRPRPGNQIRVQPDTALPARESLERRLPPAATTPAPTPTQPRRP
jgi:pilus assembly protein CpaC